jgi:Ca-activated chloride channel family protein
MSGLIHALQNFDFIWPWMLAFLPLPWLIRPFLKPAQQSQIPLLAPMIFARLQSTPEGHNALQKPRAQKSKGGLFFILWLLLILAAMRPVWFLTPTPFESSGRDLMLSVDLSGSMEKPDMILNGRKVDRLTAIKSVVDDFIEQRQGDRLGLIVFGSQAFIVSPLTYDLNTIQTLLAETEIGMAGNNTALGDSIGLAIKHFKQNKNQKAVLVLLTDGSNNAGSVQPLAAAEKAKQMGLVIHTIAFGNVQAELPVNPNQSIRGEIDLETLQKIADLTGGQAFIANQTQQLQQIYQRINELETNRFTLNQYRARTELYTWPLGLTLLLSFLWAWRASRKEAV